MALVRLFVIALVVLTIIYVSLSFYSRARARDRLEAEWDEGDKPGPREAYVKHGLADYDGSLRRKLILEIAGTTPQTEYASLLLDVLEIGE